MHKNAREGYDAMSDSPRDAGVANYSKKREVGSTAHRGFRLPKVTNDATGASLSKGVSHS